MDWFAQIVTYEPVEVQDFMKSNYRCKGIYGIYLKLTKKNRTIATQKPVRVGNIGISTDNAPKSPARTLSSSVILLEMATEYSREGKGAAFTATSLMLPHYTTLHSLSLSLYNISYYFIVSVGVVVWCVLWCGCIA
jgi:hypothetical protein